MISNICNLGQVKSSFISYGPQEEEPIVYFNDNCTEHVIAYYCKEHHDVWFVAYQVLALFVIPALLMICCYTAVIRELWKSTKNISALTNSVRSSASSETYRLKVRHSTICNPRRLLNPPSPAVGIQSYSNCEQGSPLPSISDPFGDQEDFAEKRSFDDNVQESGFTAKRPILSLDCDIPQSSSATLDLTKAFGSEKPPVTSGAGLPLYLDYDTMSDVTEHTSQATRTSALSFPRINSSSCARSNTISGTRSNSKRKSTSGNIFSSKEDFQVPEEDATGGNPRPGVSSLHNLKSPIGLRASMRNRHSFGSTSHNGGLNYKPAPFEDNSGNLRKKNTNRLGMFGYRRNRPTTATSSIHSREEWKMPPMAKREDVKKTRKQVIKMLVVVVILFVLCWSPNLIVKICKSLDLQTFNQIFLSFTYLSNMLPFIHCCINPIIYCFMSNNFRKSMWRIMAKRQSCCSDLARSHAGLPPLRNGCCKCVRYGDGCCSGNSSNSGTGCSKMCCDKQNHLPAAPPVSRVESTATKMDIVAPTSSATPVLASDWASKETRCPDKYLCGTACFYVCWCTESLPQMPGIGSPETHKGISRQNTAQFSSSAYYHEAPTAILNCTELENISNI
ncbi:G protein-coupled receptor rhodopsin-like [Trinorchestia longiramus]|nr:G protein-coupled receptor rhodopsin-like [Trinorchestia longiramus]